MRKNGFVFAFIIILGLIAAGIYYAFNYYSKEPSLKTQEITKSFPKYPNATSWLIVHRKSLCVYYFDGCLQTPSTISFTTSDQWSTIFGYYRDSLEKFNWTTNTKVITSIPQEINFSGHFSDADCDAQLQKPKDGGNSYAVQITCYPK